MTMIQLRYFTTVCRCKSVTQAAKELHVSQPSVSNSIRALEDELGIQLFYRIKLQMFLTQEGEIFLEKAVKILRDVDQLTQQMKDLRGTRKMVRVGISPMVSAMYFPEILLPFREAYMIVGRLVNMCIKTGDTLDTLTLKDFRAISNLFDEDVYDALALKTCVNERKVYGGPAKESVQKQIELIEEFVAQRQ